MSSWWATGCCTCATGCVVTADDLASHASELLDANIYLTLGTVGPDGRPWTSPVYFVADGIDEFYWTSAQDAEHSCNIARQPWVSLVVFDSTVAPYHGRALYAAARARELTGADVERGLRIYPGPASRGGKGLAQADVTGDSPWRLYLASATEVFVLCPRDPGQPCARHGSTVDHRARVA
jgi:hypothetical protein